MKKATIVRSIVALAFPTRVAALISLARAVAQGLTGNQSIPNPDPPVATLNTAIGDLETAETAAKARTKGAAQTRDEKRAAVVALLRRAKVCVQNAADADPEHGPSIIHSAGMGVRKSNAHAKHTFAVKQGAVSGEVSIEAVVAGPRAFYEWEYSADGGKTWQTMPPTTRSKTALLGLVAGTSYSFRFRSMTKAGLSDWSQPLFFLVK